MFETFKESRRKVDQFIAELDAIVKDDNNEKFRNQLSSLKSDLDSLRYTIAIIGFMKRGKSTLLNTILRRGNDQISPVRSGTCTSVIIRYRPVRDGETAGKAVVVYKDATRQQQTVGFHQLRDYIDNKWNPENEKGIRYIDARDSFPILNDSVMLVDTPGMGSLYEEHDTLTQDFLPYADAIILPLASDMLVDIKEKDFLRKLSQQEKDHIFVVVTKCDELSDQKEKNDAECIIQARLGDVGVQYDRLYWTAAKPVFEALKDGRSAEEIDRLAVQHGVKELENDLERHILEKSEKNKIFAQHFRKIMKHGQTYCEARMAEVDHDLQRFSQNYGALLAEQKEERNKAETLRKKRDKNLRDFEREWDRHVARFQNALTNKESRIVDRLTSRFEQDGFLQAVRRSPQNLVAVAVHEETRSIIQELIAKLDDTVGKLTEDIIPDLEIYTGRKGGIDKTATICNLTGGMATVATGLWSAGQFMTAVNSVTGAIAAIPAAQVAATQVGIGAKIVAFFGGASPSSAIAIGAAAPGAAISATINAIPQIGLAVGAVYLMKYIAKEGLSAIHQGRLNELTTQKLQEAGDRIVEELRKKRDQIVADFSESIEELIQNSEDRLVEVTEAVKEQDPMKKMALEDKRHKLLSLRQTHDELWGEMRLLGCEGQGGA